MELRGKMKNLGEGKVPANILGRSVWKMHSYMPTSKDACKQVFVCLCLCVCVCIRVSMCVCCGCQF